MPMKLTRFIALALPVVLAPISVGDEQAPPRAPLPPAHAVDFSLDHETVPGAAPALRDLLPVPVTPRAATAAAALEGQVLGDGFQIVGSVAVLEGNEHTSVQGAVRHHNLLYISTRFIRAFGDDYDQLAIFLTFFDRDNPRALALAQPVKNDTKGIGNTPYDYSLDFGSASGRLQSVLNMKRIVLYGRDAAADMENDLYSVWAQEAAHRWLVYFRFQRAGDAEPSTALLGRQLAHWAQGVQSEGSIMDGWSWKDNGDGTFTPLERSVRYGPLDQYGMGLRAEKDVPPFYLLEDLRREDDQPVDKSFVTRGGRYKGRRLDLTVKDLVRAMGPRQPVTEAAAQDLRMGVVLVTAGGVPTDLAIGEAMRIDRSRRLWVDFYNNAGGGRGKVCTELLRPCRGLALGYGPAATITRDALVVIGDRGAAPGDRFDLEIPVTSTGDQARPVRLRLEVQGGHLSLDRPEVPLPAIAPGQKFNLRLDGRVAASAPCAQPIRIDLTTVESGARVNPSRGSVEVMVGAVPGPLDDLEAAPERWRVDPDGTDTSPTGRWQIGAAERSEHLDFVMQPEGAFSGRNALVTGIAKGADAIANDVARGVTTVESPPISLTGLMRPTLSYRVYFVAADFDQEVLIPGTGDSLRVLASADGAAWTEVDQVTGMAVGWQRRLVKLADRLPAAALAGGSLKLRFVAEDGGAVDNIVEAVVDDVGLLGEAASCGQPPPDGGPPRDDAGTVVNPPPGDCGCHLGGRAAPTPAAAGTALLVLLLVGARRRRPPR